MAVHGRPEPLKEHGPPVARRIMAASAPAAVLRWIDDAAAQGRLDVDRGAVRTLLLTAEIAEARAGHTPPSDVLPKVATDLSTRRDADSELSSAIVLGSDPEVDLLLRLAHRHAIRLQLAPLANRLSDFTAGWIDNPARDYDPDQWALRQEILDLAHDQMQQRFTERGIPWARSALPRLWRHFASRKGDLSDPLDCYIQVAAIREMPSDKRSGRVTAMLRRASQPPGGREALVAIQQALIDWALLGTSEAFALMRNLPRTVRLDPLVIDLVMDRIESAAAMGRPRAWLLRDLGLLSQRNLMPQRAPFTGLLNADQSVLRFVESTRTREFRSDPAFGTRRVGLLGQTEPLVLQARLPLLLQTCLEFPWPGLGAGVLGILPAPLQEEMISLWARELGGEQGIHAAVWGVHWAADPYLEDLRGLIAAAFREHGSTLAAGDREKWVAAVRQEVGADHAASWVDLAEGRSRLGRLFRGKGA